MSYLVKDKEREKERYEESAQQQLDVHQPLQRPHWEELAPGLQAPLRFYVQQIHSHIRAGYQVLEIGAGTGAYTGELLSTGAEVYATDISHTSIKVINQIYSDSEHLKTAAADMELLPFAADSFDVVASAGSLSYGDNQSVLNEIERVLKDSGYFLCLDSLNHNPVYRLNRWFHYIRGRRSLGTLQRMPTVSLIESYRQRMGSVDVYFFGSLSWLLPLLTKWLGMSRAARLLDWFDQKISVRKSAYKFVMVAHKNAAGSEK